MGERRDLCVACGPRFQEEIRVFGLLDNTSLTHFGHFDHFWSPRASVRQIATFSAKTRAAIEVERFGRNFFSE